MSRVAITFLSHNDNEILIHSIKQFFNNTNFWFPVDIHVLIQCCSKAFTLSVENILVDFNKNKNNIKCILHTEKNNLGVSRANNTLYNYTRDYEYVIHLEDDWFLIGDKDWLEAVIKFMDQNKEVSTIALRKYGSEQEKSNYGWTRNIPYVCHTHKDNFDYQNKLGNKKVLMNKNEVSVFTEIKHFLFTFNPTVRRNNHYRNIFPVVEYNDIDDVDKYKDIKNHTNEKWGWCEALTMEKTRDFSTYMFEDGIFVHYDDWIDYMRENKIGPYSENYSNLVNINCHFPVLVIHIADRLPLSFSKYKHDFIRCIHYLLYDISEISSLEQILIDYKPRSIICIWNGDINLSINNLINTFFPAEYNNKIKHYKNYDDVSIGEIEIFNFQKLNEICPSPLISVITPSYESKHRILRPLRSLLSQTYSNWEWIILDDSKSNETWKTLTEFSETDHRIKPYKSTKNNGSIGDNKLICSSLSKGDFIFELDHDDDIMPETFHRIVDASKKFPDAGFFYSDCVELYENSNKTFHYGSAGNFGLGFGGYIRQWINNDFHYVYQTHRMNPHVFRHIVGVPNHFRCWTRQAYFEVNGHNPSLQVADDYDLILKTMFKFRWVHIPECLYLQYRNEDGNNFTFHRNALIQYLVERLRWLYEDNIHKRLEELGVNDDVYHRRAGISADYEINRFQYPIIDYIYRHEDSDDTPLVSIVVPTYNRTEHLRKALDSIFNQTYQNFEILVVGDNCPSLDKFVREYDKAKDKRFKYYNLPKNYGSGGAVPRNYALKMMSRGASLIAYLDDDNEWMAHHLETAIQYFRNDKDLQFVVNSMYINDKLLVFDELRRGRIDTSVVVHKFNLCVKYGLWKDRIEGGYAHDFEFFSRWKNEKHIFTKEGTLKYSTDYNHQSYDELIQM
jgi:glycosyltransferase involved in cell wall biosynthesis